MEQKSAVERFNRSAHIRLYEREDQAFQQAVIRLGTTCSRLLIKMIRELIVMRPDLLPRRGWPFSNLLINRPLWVGISTNWSQAVNSGNAAMISEHRTLVEGARDQIDQIKKELISTIYRSCHRWGGASGINSAPIRTPLRSPRVAGRSVWMDGQLIGGEGGLPSDLLFGSHDWQI